MESYCVIHFTRSISRPQRRRFCCMALSRAAHPAGPQDSSRGGSSMIPAIGLMVGAYIITRMTAMLTQPGTSKVLKVLSLITIAVALVSCLDLLTGSAAIPPGRF